MTVTYNSTSDIRPPRRLLLTLLLSALFLCAPAAKRIEKSVLENVPGRSQVVSGYSKPDSVADRLAQMPLHAVEGLWRFASEGSLMAIERNSDRAAGEYEAETTVYRMTLKPTAPSEPNA